MAWYSNFQLYILYSVKFGINIFTHCGLCQDTITTYVTSHKNLGPNEVPGQIEILIFSDT